MREMSHSVRSTFHIGDRNFFFSQNTTAEDVEILKSLEPGSDMDMRNA